MSNPLIVPPRTKQVPLLPGDYAARVEAYTRDIDEARRAAESDKRKRAQALKLAQELDDIRDDPTRVGGVIVEVREIPKVRENELLDDHPPRKGNRLDQVYGYNAATFPPALVQASLVSVRTATGVHEVTSEQFAEWAATVSPANWDLVWEAVDYVNHGTVQVPKSSAVSVLRDLLANASTRQRGTE